MLKAGPASLVGLRWLANVGPASVEAWGVAMGWGRTATYSHASRLIAAGWAERCAMARGTGSLIYATRAGVQVAGVRAPALAAAPAPTTWAHCEACAWTAAWLTARGRDVIGSRALLAEDTWRGELEWTERGGLRRRGHRPDLVGALTAGGLALPIEVELHAKSPARLRAILALHASWVAARKTRAVIYICASSRVVESVREQAAEVGLDSERKTLRVELMDTIRNAATAARSPAIRATPAGQAAESEAA